jgi:peptidoglycan/LPS O-acetylase OafA/YrhL
MIPGELLPERADIEPGAGLARTVATAAPAFATVAGGLPGPRASVERHNNNFDLLRTGAALSVLLSHAVPLSRGGEEGEWVLRLTHGQASLGQVAVIVFFIVSGYLITRAWERRRDPWRFVKARALRILPALAVCLVLLACVAGPLLSTLPASTYFASPTVPRFVVVTLSMLGFEPGLPGVFANNPYPVVVDGSLWTLRREVVCYAMVLALGLTHWLTREVVATLLIATVALDAFGVGGSYVDLGSYFLGGAAMYLWRPPLRPLFAAGAAVVLAAGAVAAGFAAAAAIAGSYLTIYAAVGVRPLRAPRDNPTDLSYGIYIWAFPVQQTATLMLGAAASWWANVLLSLPIVLGLAFLSWRLVEEPMLRLK